MRTGRVVAVLLCALGLALVAGAVTPSGASTFRNGARASKYVKGGTLTELIASNPGNLDPLTTVTGVTRGLDFYAYDPLINMTPGGKLVSGLATSWKRSGNVYTLTIRRGVTCSDGKSFGPATAAANINFLANPKNDSPLTDLFIPAGAKAKADLATSKLTISLTSPFPFFLDDLTGVGMVCTKGLDKPSLLANGTEGTGPYRISSAVAGQQYTFTIRRGYKWGPRGATTKTVGLPRKIVVKVVADPTTEADLLLGNQANLASVQGLASRPLKAAHLFSRAAAVPLGELWFNQTSGAPTDNGKVREAITSALRLKDVGGVLSQELGSPATGLVTVAPKVCPGNTVKGTLPAYDRTRADSLLSQAGWKLGPGGIRTKDGQQLKLVLLYATDIGGDPASAFELAAQELKKVGVEVSLVGDTTTALESVLFGSGRWDLVDIPLGINTPNEAVPFVSGAVPPAGENFSHIDNAGYDSLSAKAASLPGTSACSDWDKAEKDLFRSVDVVPFENAREPVWAKRATFQMVAGMIEPTSLRLLKS